MLIDKFLPEYDVVERHHVDIDASADTVYTAVRNLDLRDSKIVRWLMMVRALPAHLHSPDKRQQLCRPLTLDWLQEEGFTVLAERANEELLLGLAGRFWTPSGGRQHLDAPGFRSFERPGYAKSVWNFSLSQLNEGVTRLSTETRVRCLDDSSRRRFRLYWLFVRPFSGLIRKEMLRAIKRNAETAAKITSEPSELAGTRK